MSYDPNGYRTDSNDIIDKLTQVNYDKYWYEQTARCRTYHHAPTFVNIQWSISTVIIL